MRETAWSGNITLRMDEKEDTYSPVGSIDVERYGEKAFALKVVGGEDRCSVIMRMGREDCLEVIKKFAEALKSYEKEL